MPYFDHNATSPMSAVAREAWLRAQDEAWQNPSGPYRSAARVRNLLDAAREKLAAILGTRPGQIVFNSGATEGASAVLAWLARTRGPAERIALNPAEHPAILEAAGHFFEGRIAWLPADAPPGAPSLEGIAAVAVMAANNETGVICPWRETGARCRAARVPYVCDATQWLGKLPAAGLATAADWLVASAHKFGGPKGAGFIKIAEQAEGFSSQPGGAQERGHRGGTENYPAIAAMVAALAEAEAQKMPPGAGRLGWRGEFEREVVREIPGTRVIAQNPPPAGRLWNTVLLVMPREENTRWVALLDKRGFQVSTGSACAAGRAGPSHVLAAMGVPAGEARRAVRVSAGWETTREDWRALAAAFAGVAREL